MTRSVYISSAARTPIGGLLGSLSSLTAPELGAVAISAALERSGVKSADEVIMGNVLSAGLGQAPARQASIGAGISESVPCTTINKMCGSGLKAVMLAADAIASGQAETIVAGGMESMSNAPYLLPKARAGMRIGHGTVYDHMMLDGLEDAYDRGQAMGVFAERCAGDYCITREAQDVFALESLRRAQAADFSAEIVPVTIKNKTAQIVDKDELPQTARPDKIPTLKPAFVPTGTITAANASSISDGAAALVITTDANIKPIARIVGHVSAARKPSEFTIAPVDALRRLSEKTGWALDSVDLFEINEAFAVVTLAAMHDLKLQHDKVNINGGATALGHPIGASGARVLVTLLAALEKNNLKRGMAALCIGGGEAVAMAVERA